MDSHIEFPKPETTHLLDQVRDFFLKRRHQLQDWDSNPPHGFGFAVLFLVAMKLTLCNKLMAQTGLTLSFLSQTCGVAVGLLLLELVLANIAKQIGRLYHKKGRILTTLTLFNLSLLPLLLVLPVSLLIYFSGHLQGLGFIITLLLCLKVLGNWREALEISYEFSNSLSLLAIVVTGMGMGLLLIVIINLSLVGLLAEFLNS
jgi:hypothetical protein